MPDAYPPAAKKPWEDNMEDVIVVEMDNTTVICHKDQVQRVKELAEQQKKKG